ncbi:MAG: AAA family ATPase [Bacteroidetes bacterium]|nr:AAA family ATPase [Bacteroidota bacterium]
MKANLNSILCKSIGQVYLEGKGRSSLKFQGFKAKTDLNFLETFFKIGQMEAFLLSAFAYRKIYGDESLSLKDIIEWLKIPCIDPVPTIYESISMLIQNGLVSREISRWEKKEGQFILSESAYKTILTGDTKFLETIVVDNFHALLEKTISLYSDLRSDLIESEDFQTKLHTSIEQSFHLPELQWISKYELDLNEKFLFVIMAAHYLYYPNRSVDAERILQRIEKKYYLISKDIMNGRNALVKNNLITFATKEFKSVDEMKLSDFACEHLGLQLDEQSGKVNLEYGQLIFPEEIENKEVFYNPSVETQVHSLDKIIEVYHNQPKGEPIFKSVKVLIDGPSGTGKTQTILNLAKKSSAIIYEVGHQLKNPYVGMTEAAYAGMFKEYYQCCDKFSKQGKTVWFVINEFEGLVAKRIAAERAADFMVSTATSIFLKETDSSKFRGVMLCTSNHIDHVDSAVMRRMTIKINMVEPDKQTQHKIFASRFSFLHESEIKQLCTPYSLTGASIENVFEKYTLMRKIGQLENKRPIDLLHDICSQEISLKSPARNPIGFGNKNQ